MSPPPVTCAHCNQPLTDPPLCYAAEAPWRILGVSESELDSRVVLSDDQCIVDEKYFFIRGHIEIPIVDAASLFIWSVWCSLSDKSFQHMGDRWNEPSRSEDPAYFGWLTSQLPGYPDTLHLQTTVQSRGLGVVPLVTVFEPADHPIVQEQREGISMARVHEFAHLILHGE